MAALQEVLARLEVDRVLSQPQKAEAEKFCVFFPASSALFVAELLAARWDGDLVLEAVLFALSGLGIYPTEEEMLILDKECQASGATVMEIVATIRTKREMETIKKSALDIRKKATGLDR